MYLFKLTNRLGPMSQEIDMLLTVLLMEGNENQVMYSYDQSRYNAI